MERQKNTPSMSYLIEASSSGQGYVMHFVIEQAIPLPAQKKQRDENYNRVQRSLNELHQRTGLDYQMVYWGSPDRMRQYVLDNSIEVS